jgi:hypothetical protein
MAEILTKADMRQIAQVMDELRNEVKGKPECLEFVDAYESVLKQLILANAQWTKVLKAKEKLLKDFPAVLKENDNLWRLASALLSHAERDGEDWVQ